MGRPANEIFVTMSPLPELEAPSGAPGPSVPESVVPGPSVPVPSVHTLCTQSVMTFGSQLLGSCMHVPVQSIKAAILQLERDKFSWPCYTELRTTRASIQ